MSCYLNKKNALDNLKEELNASPLTLPTEDIQNYNVALREEVKRLSSIVDKWDGDVVRYIGSRPSVVTSFTEEVGTISGTTVPIRNIKIKFNNEVLDEIDKERKRLGIYDTKETFGSFYSSINPKNSDALVPDQKPEPLTVSFEEPIKISSSKSLVSTNQVEKLFNRNKYLQLSSNLVNPAIEELDNYLLDFLKSFNVKTKSFEELQSRLGVNALGATDVLNKLIWYVKNRNEETLPEESAHMLVALMGENHPDVKELLNNITNWSEYNSIKKEYLPIYKDENKVKIEAVGKLIAKSLVKNYKANGLDKNKLQKALQKILDYIENILDGLNFSSIFFYNENIADHIAINVLSGNKDFIYKIKNLNPNLNALHEIENNANAKQVINTFSSNNVKMTGSLAIAGTENIRRPEGQGIHDIDFKVKNFDIFNKEVLPKIPENAVPAHYGWHKKSYSTFAYLIPSKGYRIEVLERKDDFSNGWITNYKLFNEKNEQVEATQQNVMVVDFFVYKEGSNRKDFDFSSEFIPASLVYEGKMSLGGKSNPYFFSRDKDQEDYVLRDPKSFIPFEKHIYYQLDDNTNSSTASNEVIIPQQKATAQQLYSQYLESLNKPNTNPILQGNQEEQLKKFAELQERLNNKEFLEGAKNAFESSVELQNVYYEAVGFKTKRSENEITRGIKEILPFKVIGDYSNIEEGLTGRRQYSTAIDGNNYVFDISTYSYENEDGTFQSYYDIDFSVNGSYDITGTGFFNKSEKAKQIIQAIISENYGNDTIRFNVEKSEKGKQRLLLYKRLMNQLGYKPSEEMEYALFYDIKTDKVNLTPQQKQEALNAYTDYIARVSLGIVKNPTSGGYNYESQVQDIVYHGTTDDKFYVYDSNEGEYIFKLDKLNKNTHFGTLQAAKDRIKTKRFNADSFEVERAKDLIIPVIINSFPKSVQDQEDDNISWREEIDVAKNEGYNSLSYSNIKEDKGSTSYVVFEPEQIHILSSKADIQGFKEFVQPLESTANNIEGDFNLPSIDISC